MRSATASAVCRILPPGLTSANYAITYIPGTLTVAAPP
jgi:hypothetical protein